MNSAIDVKALGKCAVLMGGDSDSVPYGPALPVGDAWIALTTSIPPTT